MSNETACFYTVSELEGKLRYDGRVTHRPDRVGIDWTNSGFALRAHCRGEVKVRLEPADLPNYSYVIGLLDGETLTVEQLKTRRIRVDHADDYVLLSDIPEGEHEIRLVKITEAQVGLMDFRGLSLCGELLAPPAAGKWKIGFIGDSLTGGLHNLCRVTDVNLIAQDNEDGYHAYDGFTARHFDADIHVVSLSGWGVVCGWGKPRRDYSVPRALPYTSIYRDDSENGRWDFSRWQPDAVVINLGSNDSSSTDDDPSILSGQDGGIFAPAERVVPPCPVHLGTGHGRIGQGRPHWPLGAGGYRSPEGGRGGEAVLPAAAEKPGGRRTTPHGGRARGGCRRSLCGAGTVAEGLIKDGETDVWRY